MNKDWEVLTLGGYLQPEQLANGFTTFTRTLQGSPLLSNVKVGLAGMPYQNFQSVTRIPMVGKSRTVMPNTFLNEIAEQYLELSSLEPTRWQELLLLHLGYVNHPNATYDDNFTLFAEIPQKERLPLLRKHGFHKIALLVAYKITENLDEYITSLDETLKDMPEGTGYGKLLELLAADVPLDDLSLAAQLPDDLIDGLYGE